MRRKTLPPTRESTTVSQKTQKQSQAPSRLSIRNGAKSQLPPAAQSRENTNVSQKASRPATKLPQRKTASGKPGVKPDDEPAADKPLNKGNTVPSVPKANISSLNSSNIKKRPAKILPKTKGKPEGKSRIDSWRTNGKSRPGEYRSSIM